MLPTDNSADDKDRAYRRRLAEKGRHQILLDLPKETIAFLDEFKERYGLSSRGRVVQLLTEQGRRAVQQTT